MATRTGHAHPTTRTYWLVALVLAVITAVEIAVPYLAALDPIRVPLLLLLGGAKFSIVVAVFMHLKYDLKSYRFYFAIGLAGTLVVFAVVLASFQAF